MSGLFSSNFKVLNEPLYFRSKIRTRMRCLSDCVSTEMIFAGINVICWHFLLPNFGTLLEAYPISSSKVETLRLPWNQDLCDNQALASFPWQWYQKSRNRDSSWTSTFRTGPETRTAPIRWWGGIARGISWSIEPLRGLMSYRRHLVFRCSQISGSPLLIVKIEVFHMEIFI